MMPKPTDDRELLPFQRNGNPTPFVAFIVIILTTLSLGLLFARPLAAFVHWCWSWLG